MFERARHRTLSAVDLVEVRELRVEPVDELLVAGVAAL
jgi:hypothetical protein